MMGFTVRTARLADLDALVAFTLLEARHAEGIEKSPDIVREGAKVALDDPSIARYWILENQEGEVIGNISIVREWSNWNAGYYWRIQSMFIAPEYRGRKLMGYLIEAVRKAAKSENALDIRLLVHQDNHRAQKAYYRWGFSNGPYDFMILILD
jgi:GNAT superfamily N-acetyltransferase